MYTAYGGSRIPYPASRINPAAICTLRVVQSRGGALGSITFVNRVVITCHAPSRCSCLWINWTVFECMKKKMPRRRIRRRRSRERLNENTDKEGASSDRTKFKSRSEALQLSFAFHICFHLHNSSLSSSTLGSHSPFHVQKMMPKAITRGISF